VDRSTDPRRLSGVSLAGSVRRVNQAAEGKEYEPVPFDVSEARVRAFHGLFGGPPGVPLTLLTAAEFSVLPQIIGDPELALDFRKVVHGSQEYEYRRPLRLGDTLAVHARIASIRQKAGNGFLVVEMQKIGIDGKVAAVARSTMIERDMSGCQPGSRISASATNSRPSRGR
jgi:acyl dehydratase